VTGARTRSLNAEGPPLLSALNDIGDAGAGLWGQPDTRIRRERPGGVVGEALRVVRQIPRVGQMSDAGNQLHHCHVVCEVFGRHWLSRSLVSQTYRLDRLRICRQRVGVAVVAYNVVTDLQGSGLRPTERCAYDLLGGVVNAGAPGRRIWVRETGSCHWYR